MLNAGKTAKWLKNGETGARVLVFNTTLTQDLIEFRLHERAFRVVELTAVLSKWLKVANACMLN